MKLILDKILDKTKNKEVRYVDLPAKLIPRPSCGCHIKRERPQEQDTERIFPVSQFLDDFNDCFNKGTIEARNLFLYKLEKILRELAELNGELTGYQQRIIELRHSVFSEFVTNEDKIRAGALWDEIYLLITEIMQQLQIKKN